MIIKEAEKKQVVRENQGDPARQLRRGAVASGQISPHFGPQSPACGRPGCFLPCLLPTGAKVGQVMYV